MDEWHAHLKLRFAPQGTSKTVLAERRHEGPLLVQKALYPEGPGVCHVTMLHPPSGIAGGDVLAIDVKVQSGAHALLSTPGATRWYKSNGRLASQEVTLTLEAGARLDWLPQENIVFEHAQAATTTLIHLHSGASLIGWETTQLGAIQSPRHWEQGSIQLNTVLTLDGERLWLDAGELGAADTLRHSANGLAGFPVMATLWAFGPSLDAERQEELAQTLPWTKDLRAGLTYMPKQHGQGLSLLRVLGMHTQNVRALLIEAWQQLRPALMNTAGVPLRLWNT